MYDAVSDAYCYPGTTVPKNRAGLRTQTDLDFFEEEATAQRFAEPLPAGTFDLRHLCAIHRHLFQDVYPWAGALRIVRISKGGSAFCYPENLDRDLGRLFADLASRKTLSGLDAESFAEKAAHFLAELNAIHPFREGNGRTQLSFLAALADQAGHSFVLERLDPKAMLDATITSWRQRGAARKNDPWVGRIATSSVGACRIGRDRPPPPTPPAPDARPPSRQH
jgi:cell filamentation protein